MSTKTNYLQTGLLSVLLGISLVLIANPTFAQTTTSAISVDVVDQSGNPVEGVGVRITHIPTQRSSSMASRACSDVRASSTTMIASFKIGKSLLKASSAMRDGVSG